MSDALVATGPVGRPLPRRSAPRWLRLLARLPGALAAPLSLGAASPLDDGPRLETVAQLAETSPRGTGYLALEPGLERVGDETAVLAYSSWRRSAFATGGLLAPSDGAPAALARLRERLAGHGFRRLLLFPVAESELATVRAAGLHALEVGAEALLEPAAFGLAGSRMADLRSMCHRAERGGLWVREADPGRDREALAAAYDAWAGHFVTGRSMRLLVGTPAFDRPLRRRYFAAFRGAGRVEALVTLTPGWDGAGYGLDVLARRPDAQAGAMDYLLTTVIEQLAAEGVEHFSLGACPMLEVPGRRRPGVLGAFFRYLYRARWANRLFPFQGLSYFKGKFAPRWEPVYLAGWPRVGAWSLYVGCRMWGLFD